MDLVDQFWIQRLTAIPFGVILLAEVLFLPETLYPREYAFTRLPGASVSLADAEKITAPSAADTELREQPNCRVPGMRHPKPWDSPIRVALLFKFSVVPIAVFCLLLWLVLVAVVDYQDASIRICQFLSRFKGAIQWS